MPHHNTNVHLPHGCQLASSGSCCFLPPWPFSAHSRHLARVDPCSKTVTAHNNPNTVQLVQLQMSQTKQTTSHANTAAQIAGQKKRNSSQLCKWGRHPILHQRLRSNHSVAACATISPPSSSLLFFSIRQTKSQTSGKPKPKTLNLNLATQLNCTTASQ